MMLAWKSAACLAAGNTLVLKPAQVSSFAFLSFEFKWLKAQKLFFYCLLHLQVTPLTALKFAELSVKAGIPKGVINILPGSGNVVVTSQHFECHLVATCSIAHKGCPK